MNQREAVIAVMEANGGYATLGYLYQQALKMPNVKWGSKTPAASIRRIVQNDQFFFKIKPGLWALIAYKSKIPFNVGTKKKSEQTKEFNHTYYQGLLVEIGNLKRFQTYVPSQDKNKIFLDKPLNSLVSIQSFYDFTYPDIVKRARTIDVTWFNERKYPSSFFEVEHSTDIQNSLLKFTELQDFNVEFWIVADKFREKEFRSKLTYHAFSKMGVKFISYDQVSEWHSKTSEFYLFENKL